LPALTWTPGPAGTKSYAITFIDTFLAPEDMLGYHWVIWNIPANVTSLPEEFTDAASIGAKQNREYLGPCPNYPSGSAEHTYEFTIYALDTETIAISPETGIPAVQDAEAKLEADHLQKATLGGVSSASPP
jgi:Raf kinase inhibitor-like YbhB/YbcL family protein